ncbi:ASCH domain-containing protein [Sulfitobacter noctilucae]|uniref:ASCH domain-containing protein n=1 Tax=Sulfitobacter noctilucae TaxID=1342302 RepID=UPI000468FFEE|nr:ASCH domain-containing protein [Sulfitobacter noctilucae]
MMITETEALARYPGAVSFKYGDSAKLNAEILKLVLIGKKTVTCDAVAAFEARGEAKPVLGRVDVALDWTGRPVAAVRTLAVDIVPFDEMSEPLIVPQGEFSDLTDWRRGYEAYLTRAGLFARDVAMLVETFEVVERF